MRALGRPCIFQADLQLMEKLVGTMERWDSYWALTRREFKGLAADLRATSSLADYSSTCPFTGEVEMAGFIAAYVLTSINGLLRLTLGVKSGLRVVWEVADRGAHDKLDLEKVLRSGEGGGTRQPLAFCRVKTAQTLPGDEFEKILGAVERGRLFGGDMTLETEETSQGSMVGRAPDVSVPIDRPDTPGEVMEEVAAQLFRKNLSIAVLTSYDNHMVVERNLDRGMATVTAGPMVNDRSGEWALADVIFAASVRALHNAGILGHATGYQRRVRVCSPASVSSDETSDGPANDGTDELLPLQPGPKPLQTPQPPVPGPLLRLKQWVQQRPWRKQ